MNASDQELEAFLDELRTQLHIAHGRRLMALRDQVPDDPEGANLSRGAIYAYQSFLRTLDNFEDSGDLPGPDPDAELADTYQALSEAALERDRLLQDDAMPPEPPERGVR